MLHKNLNLIISCILLMLSQSMYSQNKYECANLCAASANKINSNDTISFSFTKKENIIFELGRYNTPKQLNPGYTARELYDFSCGGTEYEQEARESRRKIKQLYASIIGFADSTKKVDIIRVTVSPNGDIIYISLCMEDKKSYNLHAIDSFIRNAKMIKFPPCQIYKQFMILANKKF